jgi:hypothetical protein
MSKATARVGRRADIPQSEVSFWVNEAYQAISEVAPHNLQECIAISSTTSGENRFALPTDLKELIDFSYLTNIGASARTLRRISESAADIQDPDALGVPDTYVLFNDFIELWPSPNSAYSIQMRYRIWPGDLTSLTSTPSVSTPFKHAILLKTEQYLHEYLGNDERAVNAEFRYQQWLSQIQTDEARRQKGQSRLGVTPVW